MTDSRGGAAGFLLLEDGTLFRGTLLGGDAPSVAEVVLTATAAASTLTVSVAAPTSRVKFCTDGVPRFNVMPVRFAVLKPGISTVTV